MKEAANDERKIIYLSSNGTDNIDCLSYHGIIFSCQTLGYIMRYKCMNGIGDKIIIHVLWDEIPIMDCEWDDYLNKFSYFNRFGPHCDLEISGIINGDQVPTFTCLNSSEGRQNLPLSNRHIEFTNGYDYYSHSNYDYQDTAGDAYSAEEFPMPKFIFSNLKFVGIIIDLTSIDAAFEQVIFENSMIQHFPNWEYDCYITFESCTFRRTRDDVANFGYPDWIPDYIKHFKSMRGDLGMAPSFRDGFLLGPWPHSPIFMERCKSVRFSMTNTSWTSGTIAVFYQEKAEITILNSSFTNSQPFQTFIWIDGLSLMYFEMYKTIEDSKFTYNTTLTLFNVLFKDIHNNMTNVPNVLRITTRSDTILHVSDSIIVNTSGFLYAYLTKPSSMRGYGEIYVAKISFIENISPTGLLFSNRLIAHVKITSCIFKDNQAIEPTDDRVLHLYSGKPFYLPQNGEGKGAALYIDSFLSFKIISCTFLNNISPRGGGALHIMATGGWQRVLEIEDSFFQCCETTTVTLQSGYILSADMGLKLRNVTFLDNYVKKRYIPSILFISLWEPLLMSDTHVMCPRGNEIERKVKESKKVFRQKGFKSYDIACISCSYPGFNNQPLKASYYDNKHRADHNMHNQTFTGTNTMNVFKYYSYAEVIEELENTQCSTGNCPFGAVCGGLLFHVFHYHFWDLMFCSTIA